MKRGLFITIEGSDGSGKSTQIRLLTDFLKEQGLTFLVTREPGGTKISEAIRALLLDKNNREMSPETEMLLYAASRAQHVAELIRPALEKGTIVICDRFLDSSIAYQGYGRGLGPEKVIEINSIAVRDCLPDLTFFLKLNPSLGQARIKNRAHDRLELEQTTFHDSVFSGYLALEKDYPERIVGIEAEDSVEAIFKKILPPLQKLLKEWGHVF